MTFLGITIKRHSVRETLKESILASILLGVSLLDFCAAAVNSGYFAYYRLGDSIIPKEEQLVKSGPYAPSFMKVRSGTKFLFISSVDGSSYTEKYSNFNKPVTINDLIRKVQGQAVVYLWLDPGNPVRNIWRIDINGQTVLNYEYALKDYSIESRQSFWLINAAIFFTWFLLCMFSIQLQPSNKKEQ